VGRQEKETPDEVIVREMDANDRAAWAEMRSALWPDDTPQAHAAAIDELLKSDANWGFVAEILYDGIVGFAEVAIRNYANGCDSRPVAFLEGIWVRPELRRRGIGSSLVRHAEALLVSQGFRELGSDTEINNRASQKAHLAWGFSETERVVYFRKTLKG
jgi:aminoglycoside 6'-N-acetyltransferase I